MNRRQFLGAATVTALPGCSAFSVRNNSHTLGETVAFGEIEVTVTDVMTTREVRTYLDTVRGENVQRYEAPSNAKVALFYLEAHNTDITERNGPAINTENYVQMTEDEDSISMVGINDVRVYGGSEGGYLPDSNIGSYDGIRVNGAELNAYPAGPGGTGPAIKPTETVEGWMYGIIPKDKSPRLKVDFNDKSAIWDAKSSDLGTPTSQSRNL
jgi:hypothetical protein